MFRKTMPLHEAIALGQRGCALGRAVDAVGQTRANVGDNYFGSVEFGDFENAPNIWPWLKEKSCVCPKCKKFHVSAAYGIIMHVWDNHVTAMTMTPFGGLSFEEFLDWVESLEPEDVPTADELENVEIDPVPNLR